MKIRRPPLWVSIAILAVVLLWRMIGAPVTAEQFHSIKTPVWQARILLPARMQRVFSLWFSRLEAPAETMVQEMDGNTYEQLTQQEEVWVSVYLAHEDRLAQMTLDGYVCGVTAAEMPAAYHLEALKAQAVAARTRVLAQQMQGGCSKHAGADICTDSAHCQGYATPAECRAKWGSSYEAYRNRILQAEAETAGQWITYDGQPITVMYHAISGGRTEAAQTVFSQSIPYLISVESLGEESARGFQEELTMTFEEIASLLRKDVPGMNCTAQDIQRSLTIGSYTQTGRVNTVQIGDTELAATAFRHALGLRSTWFSISSDESGITFHQKGYGHGVGMSQAGANSMAASGSDYTQILLHYYPGVQLDTYRAE